MKFFSNCAANVVVWDPENEAPLCTFENGVFETGDPDIAGKLIKAGYAYEGEIKGVGASEPNADNANSGDGADPGLDSGKGNGGRSGNKNGKK